MSVQLGNEFWKSRLGLRDEQIAELEKQIANLESQLSIAFEIMFDSQIAECQELFERSIDIEHSASTNHTQQGEN